MRRAVGWLACRAAARWLGRAVDTPDVVYKDSHMTYDRHKDNTKVFVAS